MKDIEFLAESQAMKRMKEIDDKIDIDNMLKVQELTDIERAYCIDPSLGHKIRNNIITTFLEQEKTITKAQKDELLHGNNIRVSKHAIIPYFRNQLCSFGDAIDWDKFLLLSAYRARTILLSENCANMTQEAIGTLRKIMQAALDLINNKSVRMSAELDFGTGKVKHVEYSFEELLRDLEHGLDRNIDGEKIQLDKWKEEISQKVKRAEER